MVWFFVWFMIKFGYINFWATDLDDMIRQEYIVPLKEKGFDVDMTIYNPVEVEVDVCLHSVFRDPLNIFKVKGNPVFICYSGENRLDGYLHPNGYSMSFRQDSERNIYYPIWANECKNLKFRLPFDELIKNKDKFCTFIISNSGFWWRNVVAEQLCLYRRIDSCGTALNNMENGFVLPRDLESCVNFHKRYKFNLCFENSFDETSDTIYITEKLINAYVYGTVPIYWGSDKVTKWFNEKAFVNCNGKSSGEIVELIKRIDSDNDLYFEMLSQPLFKEEYRNIDFHKMNKDKYVDFFKSVIWKEIYK